MYKTGVFQQVWDLVKDEEWPSVFTNYQVRKETGLDYYQVRRSLDALVELGELRYVTTNKTYVKMERLSTGS